jgi:hypothetical protein
MRPIQTIPWGIVERVANAQPKLRNAPNGFCQLVPSLTARWGLCFLNRTRTCRWSAIFTMMKNKRDPFCTSNDSTRHLPPPFLSQH